MLSLTQTRKLLEELGHSPKKALGQNFLIDANIVRKSLALAKVKPDDSVVEVGPGLGTLTQSLLKAGAKVYAVEADPTMFRYQTENLVPTYPKQLSVVNADAVKCPRADLPLEIAETGQWKIVANLPYAISTPWLEGVLCGPLPRSITVMIQKETADRFMADSDTKSFGAVSVFLQAAFQRVDAHPVAKTCFHPSPEVDSVIAHFVRLEKPVQFDEATRRDVRQIFTQRRKQIGGILRRINDPEKYHGWLSEIQQLGVTRQSRPEQIPLEAWLKLVERRKSKATQT